MDVDFINSEHAPLLFIAGGNDHILPPAVERENYDKHAKHSQPFTAYRELEGRCHWTCGEPGWADVVDLALAWARAPMVGEVG